jgi:hypothetical protein
VWILGLKPSTGGSLKAGRSSADSNAVITTAVMADLPVLSAMLSRLFESSQYLDETALHHLVDALCKLSREAMELAYSNRVNINANNMPTIHFICKFLFSNKIGAFIVCCCQTVGDRLGKFASCGGTVETTHQSFTRSLSSPTY